MIGRIANLAIWEWFKLRHRWLLWILLAVAMIFGTLDVVGSLLSYRHLQQTGGEVFARTPQGKNLNLSCNDLLTGGPDRQPSDVDAQIVEGMRAQCRQQAPELPERFQSAYDDLSLPGAIPSALSLVAGLGLTLVAILTASAIGIDYGSGALRTVLVQGAGRGQYLAAKLLTLTVLAGAGLVVAVACTVVASSVAQLFATAPASVVPPPTWSDAAVAVVKSWSSLLPYLALTGFVTVLARSSAAGMAFGLGYQFFERIVTQALQFFFPNSYHTVTDYLLGQNIALWTSPAPDPTGPDATHAAVVLAAYTLAFVVIALAVFHRRDVAGSTSS